MDQPPVKATIPRIATRFTQSKKASYSNCLRRQDVFYNLNEWLEAMGKFSELDDHSFFSSALVQSARHRGLSPVAERQFPKLHVRGSAPIAKAQAQRRPHIRWIRGTMVLPMSRLKRNLESLDIRSLEDTVWILTLVADRCNATPCP